MKSFLPFALAVALVGPPEPCKHEGSYSKGSCGPTDPHPENKHHSNGWKWATFVSVVAGGTILAYKIGEPPHLKERRGIVGPACAPYGCVPPGGF